MMKNMIVYLPDRMPHIDPYGTVHYDSSTFLETVPNFYNLVSGYSINPELSYYGNLVQQSLDLLDWPQNMPAEDEHSPAAGLTAGLRVPSATLSNGSPPSPTNSDSDASSSSLELGTIRPDENAKLHCRWQNCDRCFASLEQLAAHVSKLHAAPGPRGLFYCGWQGCARGERGFNARYKMLVHVRTHTNEKPHHCYQCDKSFSRAENLKIHARSHTGERPYVCPVEGCNKAYSNSSDRFKHTRTHAVDKPYCCKVPGCPKRYTDPSSLRKHVKTYRHYINNNNDKVQEKSFDDNHVQEKTRFDTNSPDKQNNSAHSESDKKDSSIDNSTTISSPNGSNSFDEQGNFMEWNNMHNFHQDRRKEQEQIISTRSYEDDMKIYTNMYDDYNISDRIQVNPTYASGSTNDCSSVLSLNASPSRVPEAIPSINKHQQSTPIKTEEPMECSGIKTTTVDYRNIESIVNSTPCKKENMINCDPVRHSVIKRAKDLKLEMKEMPLKQDFDNTTTNYCCRNKCCMHSNNGSNFQKRLFSELIMKTSNPFFRHLLNSVDLQYGLENAERMWSDIIHANKCGQDLKIKNEKEQDLTKIEQDLPLDLTINNNRL